MSIEGGRAAEQPKAKELQQFLNKNMGETSDNLRTSERAQVDSIENYFGVSSSEGGKKTGGEVIDLLSDSDSDSDSDSVESFVMY